MDAGVEKTNDSAKMGSFAYKKTASGILSIIMLIISEVNVLDATRRMDFSKVGGIWRLEGGPGEATSEVEQG